jgi:hypothetical protein
VDVSDLRRVKSSLQGPRRCWSCRIDGRRASAARSCSSVKVVEAFSGLALVDPLFYRFLVEAPVAAYLERGNLMPFEKPVNC